MTTTAPDTDTGVSIRPAELADLLDVVRIEQQSFSEPWPYRVFEEFLGEPGFLVAADHSVAGYVIADAVADRGRVLGHVKDFAVAPPWRGQGIGTRLLDRALSILEAQGIRRAKLEVRQSNEDAISLYRRFGFEPHHLIPRYYPDGEAAAVFVVDLEEGHDADA